MIRVGSTPTTRTIQGPHSGGQTVYRAVGIDICEPDVQGKGTRALLAFLGHHFSDGADALCTQTWSGNVRMIRCAEKLGFAECDRKAGIREVNGQRCDGLTFRKERPRDIPQGK